MASPPRNSYPKRLGDCEIRLLEVQPGRWMDDINCELSYRSLRGKRGDGVAYVAMSYVWGSEPAALPIQVDGETVLITPGLDLALRHYRRRMVTGDYWTWNGLPRRLWVDSVCINQNDKEEQGTQVAVMDSIYGLAHAIFVFLDGGLNLSSPSYPRVLTALSGIVFKRFGLERADFDFYDEGNIFPPPTESEIEAKQQAWFDGLLAEVSMVTDSEHGRNNQVISGNIEETDELAARLSDHLRDITSRAAQIDKEEAARSSRAIATTPGPGPWLQIPVSPSTRRDMHPTALFSFMEAVVSHAAGEHFSAIWTAWNDHPAVSSLCDPHQREFHLSEGLQLVLNSKWWQRVWTLQEGVVGTYPTFILGGASAPWKLLRQAAESMSIPLDSKCECCMRWLISRPFSLGRHLIGFVDLMNDLNRSRRLAQISRDSCGTIIDFLDCKDELLRVFGTLDRKRNAQTFAADYFLRLLEQHRRRQATDPRDKAYAILPLVGMAHVQPLLVPSYTTGVSEAFIDVARAIVSGSGYLDILAFAANTSGALDLPSWVPDWSSHENLDSHLRIASLENYHTSGEARAEAHIAGRVLTVKAACLGVVQSCGKPMNSKKRLWTTLHKWLRLAACHPSRKEAYRRHRKSGWTLWNEFRRTVHVDMVFSKYSWRPSGFQVPMQAVRQSEDEHEYDQDQVR